MLILSRRTGQAIYLDRHIKVTLLEIKGNQIRLGIEAPENVSIHRDNIKSTIKKSKGQEKQAREGTLC